MKKCPNPKCGYEHNHAHNKKCQRCKHSLRNTPEKEVEKPDAAMRRQ